MHPVLIQAGEAHHRRILVVSRFVLAADRQKQERGVVDVCWHAVLVDEANLRQSINVTTGKFG